MMTTLWCPPPPQLFLPLDEIHLWRAPLTLSGPDLSCLAHDERARAERLRSEQKRCQFIAGRILLRQILARYLDTDPRALRFVYGPHGKPQLDNGRLEFNLAHAGDLLLLAVSGCGAVGADLERVDARIDWAGVAERTFSVATCTALAALPAHRQRRSFYRFWTRHEALLKATGGGFAGSAALPAGDDWRLCNLHVGRGYLATLALRGNPAAIRRFSLVGS